MFVIILRRATSNRRYQYYQRERGPSPKLSICDRNLVL